MSQLQNQMREYLDQLSNLQEKFEEELKELPAGSLYIRKGLHSESYYHCYQLDKKWLRVPLDLKKKVDLLILKQLQRRRFIQSSLPIIKADIAVLKQALHKFIPYDP